MATPSSRQAAQREGDDDISRDFSCFLCNGFIVVLGCITLQPTFVRLSVATGRILEEFEYSSVCSVNEEEPPTTHSLIFNLPHHSVYVCHLLRKTMLLKVFQRLGVYNPDVRLPAESLGFPTAGNIGGQSCSLSTARLVPLCKTCVCGHHHRYIQDEEDHKEWPNTHNSKPLQTSSTEQETDHRSNDLQITTTAPKVLTPTTSQINTQTTPPSQADSPAQQLRDLVILFPHLPEELLQEVLAKSGHNTEKVIESLTDDDQLANAPHPPVSLTHT